jgi:hypothetical protein
MLRSTFCEMSSCGLKSRIFITAGHRPAERMCTLSDCLKRKFDAVKGRTVIGARRPAFDCVELTFQADISPAHKTMPCAEHVLRNISELFKK